MILKPNLWWTKLSLFVSVFMPGFICAAAAAPAPVLDIRAAFFEQLQKTTSNDPKPVAQAVSSLDNPSAQQGVLNQAVTDANLPVLTLLANKGTSLVKDDAEKAVRNLREAAITAVAREYRVSAVDVRTAIAGPRPA
ncbi:MAG: hypothetical protein AAB323_02210 [Pseudomonadota bacterium]